MYLQEMPTYYNILCIAFRQSSREIQKGGRLFRERGVPTARAPFGKERKLRYTDAFGTDYILVAGFSSAIRGYLLRIFRYFTRSYGTSQFYARARARRVSPSYTPDYFRCTSRNYVYTLASVSCRLYTFEELYPPFVT